MSHANLPIRKVKGIHHFTNILCSKSDEKTEHAIDEYVFTQVENGSKNQDSVPRYFYILHEKRDGELASFALHDSFLKRSEYSSILLDSAFQNDEASSYIKKRCLRRISKQIGIWPKAPLIPKSNVRTFIAWLVSTMISVLSIVISLFNEGNSFLSVLNSHRAERLYPFLAIIFAFVSAFLLIQIIISHEREAFAEVDRIIISLSDIEFFSFIERVPADDFRFSGLSHVQENANIICPLSRYKPRQRAILKRFWMSNNKLEYWWIFIERRADNSSYVLDKSPDNKYRLAFMELCRLATTQKKDLARQFGHDPDDPGINKNGVDYIASSLLNIGITPPSESLKLRIDQFIQREENSFPYSIRKVIDVVVELSAHYQIDFSSARYWEELFRYPVGTTHLVDLDFAVSKTVFFPAEGNDQKLSSLPELVSLIINEFGEELDSISILNTGKVYLQSFVQLCLIKALRYRWSKDDECFLAVAGTLFSEMKKSVSAPESFCDGIWISIFLQALTVLEHAHYGVYSPAFLHLLITIYDASGDNGIQNNKRLKGLFMSPIVIETARANLLLNHSSFVDELQEDGIDVIYDHYRIICIILLLQGKSNILSRSCELPECFGILNLTQLQRKEYYNALCTLNERDIIDYYYLMFDIYCASLAKRFHLGFIKPVYTKNLLLRYKEDAENPLVCMGMALRSLAALLKKLYPYYPLVSEDLPKLIDILDKGKSDDAGVGLFYLAKWDAFSFVTGSFIVGMICHAYLDKELTDYRNIYLNMGSYIIRLVFLTEHENQEESWHNDDFQYLVSILVQHVDPSHYLLTHIVIICEFAMPEQSNIILTNYLKTHLVSVKNSFVSIQTKLNEDELEDYITFIDVLPLEKTAKCSIVSSLRNILPTRYVRVPCMQLLFELLNYLIDGCFSDEMKEQMDTVPDSIIERLKKTSPNTVFRMYTNLCESSSQFEKYCPRLASDILKSDYTNAPVVLAAYLKRQPKSSVDYASVAKNLYEYLYNIYEKKTLIAQSIQCISPLIETLSLILRKSNEDNELYSWVDDQVIFKLIERLRQNRNDIIEIESKTMFRERKWGRYGLLVFLKYLLTKASEKVVINEPDKGYFHLNNSERISWLEKHYLDIAPIYIQNNLIYANGIFVDMLDVFLANEEKIHDRISETQIQSYIIIAIRHVVSMLFENDPVLVNRIQIMISEYCQAIGIT